MKFKTISQAVTVLVMLAFVLSLFTSTGQAAPTRAPANAPSAPVSFTILHTNDFHGQLEEVLAGSPGTSSNPGMSRVATIVNNVRTSVGADKVLLVDGGDEMQGSLLSNLQQGAPTIDVFNAMGYIAATFGNHEFDWGQSVLAARTTQAAHSYLTANIVVNDTGDCTTAGWTTPTFADSPYVIHTFNPGTSDEVKVAFIGVTTPETPTITIASATAGLCFKDPALSIQHYYPNMLADGANVIVVLSHLGYADGGSGYGIPVYGDQTLAARLNTALTPVNLIIGGHSHTNLSSATTVGSTKVVTAHYNGRKVGRADVTVGTDGSVSVNWSRITVCAANNTSADCPSGPTVEDPAIKGVITTAASDPGYQALINTLIGYTNVPITRYYNGDSLMGYFVNDAVYNDLNNDGTTANDVDMVFNNPGGLRADITCAGYPCQITYGMMFNVLPFGNQTIVGDMRGDRILELLHQSASLYKGAIQTSGIRYSFFYYAESFTEGSQAPAPYGWGAYDVTVYDKTSSSWVPLDLTKTYRVATNEFLAPAGQDGFVPFKYMTNISYWDDMLLGVNRWVNATYTVGNPYNGVLDGRITRNGNGDHLYDAGEIVPVTILHHNDSHGNLVSNPYIGYPQLAYVIKQERARNPTRTLLLSSGDNIQGDSMSYFFKTAPTGFTSDGTAIADPALHIQPLIKVFNAMGYDAMTLGNHEFNFGKDVFTSVLGQAEFPLLQANLTDTGEYGLATAGVQPYVEKTIGGDINVAILGIGNHRIPNYELPSNIPGLTFSDPILKAQELSALLRPTNDIVIALTHIGFTALPGSLEVDLNVDDNLAASTSGLDVVVGGHSHTDPSGTASSTYLGTYKYQPAIISDPDGNPVVVSQAYRYNNTLGEVSIGLEDLGGGNYEVVSQTGRYIQLCASNLKNGSGKTCSSATPQDAAIKALIDPYAALLNTYNTTVIGQTTTLLDTLQAFTQETNGANLQADAAVYELETVHGIPVDFHLSGAMTNKTAPYPAPGAYPASLKISDMFGLMPYENSLVVISMNGPQLKAVLERGYRNYFYYKYVSDHGGYSYYTTCMLDTNAGNEIKYNDLYPALPNGKNVVSLTIGGVPVNFTDATTYYNVSTVNYLAAGSCNFKNGTTTLWPLNQIVADTQYYVRDAVIDYVTAMGTVSPAVEGRLAFITDTTPPVITITSPLVNTYLNTTMLPVDFSATDDIAGVKRIVAKLDGVTLADGTTINLKLYKAGTTHKLVVTSWDNAANSSINTVTFKVKTSIAAMKTVTTWLYNRGDITSATVYHALIDKLNNAAAAPTQAMKVNALNAYIGQVTLQTGLSIPAPIADLLKADIQWLINTLP